MTARVLIVDDVPANLKLLEARLTAEYFEVVQAAEGRKALEVCASGACDIVLLDVMMPGMDGFEVCRRIKDDPATMHLPVVMITALNSPSDRVRGLESGADDFLTKPVNDVALITRVRSLVRLKMLTDQLGARAATSSQLGMELGSSAGLSGRILLVDDRPASAERVVSGLSRQHKVQLETNPQEAMFRAAEGSFDLVIINLDLAGHDGLRLCSQLRSLDRTRTLPILVLVGQEDESRLMRALEMGVNDYLSRPLDRNEMLARVRTQIRRKRYTDQLRDSVQLTIEMATTDSLTGLYNRRYFERHLQSLVDQANARKKPLSLLILDVDHFKAINDTYGHAAGDAVLTEFSRRVRSAVRGLDLVSRYGGEEFVIAMPDTPSDVANRVGERLREKVGNEPFVVGSGPPITVTVSIGVSLLNGPTDSQEALIERADAALYQAKRAGRNRVASAAA